MTRTKTIISILAALLLIPILVLSACAAPQPPAKESPKPSAPAPDQVAVTEWKIPLLMLQTGPQASLGQEIVWVCQNAVDKINAAGGIRGKPVKLDVKDTALDPARAVAAARDVAPSALVILGPATSIEVKSAAPVAKEAGVAMLCVGMSTVSILADNAPYAFTFRTDPGSSSDKAIKEWLTTNPTLRNYVLFQETKNIGYTAQSDGMTKALQANGAKQLGKQTHESGEINYSAQVTQARDLKPDFYLVVSAPPDIARIIVELRKQGVTQPVLAGFDFQSDEGWKIGGQAIEGTTWLAEYFSELDAPDWQTLKKAFFDKYQRTVLFASDHLFYDAIYVIKDAFEKKAITGDPSKLKEERAKILEYIQNIKSFPGINGKFTMTPGGYSQRTMYILQVKDLKPFLIKAVEP